MTTQNETAMWGSLQPRLATLGLHPIRVENALGAGTPDVNYIHGWMELKHLKHWPARPETPVRFLFDPRQAAWLMERWKRGGATWVMAQVARQWMLFVGWDAHQVRQGLPRELLLRLAVWTTTEWSGSMRGAEKRLKAWLTQDTDALPPNDAARLCRLMCCKSLDDTAEELGQIMEFGCTAYDVDRAEREVTPLTSDLLEYWTV